MAEIAKHFLVNCPSFRRQRSKFRAEVGNPKVQFEVRALVSKSSAHPPVMKFVDECHKKL